MVFGCLWLGRSPTKQIAVRFTEAWKLIEKSNISISAQAHIVKKCYGHSPEPKWLSCASPHNKDFLALTTVYPPCMRKV